MSRFEPDANLHLTRMNDLQPYKLEIRSLMQAAINAELLQERLDRQRLKTLQRSCRGSDQAVLVIVIFLVKARGRDESLCSWPDVLPQQGKCRIEVQYRHSH
jgi:hypothetical protein